MKIKFFKLLNLFEGELEIIDKTKDCCDSVFVGSCIEDIPNIYDNYTIKKMFVGALDVLIIWIEE